MSGLYYSNQVTRKIFDAVTLSGTLTDNQKTFETGGFSKLTIYSVYEMGSGETAQTLDIQLEASPDGGTTWTTLPIDETSTISEISARAWQMEEGALNIIVDIAYPLMRCSLKESTVSANNGTATVFYTLSGL